MGGLIEKIFDFFGSKALSLSKKMTISTLVCLIIVLVDNCCGFSYYFVQSYKLDYITSLEDARVKYAKDRVVSQELDRMMVNALNRWTVFNAVFDIFQKTFNTTSEAREQQLVEEITKNRKEKTENKIEKSNESNIFLSQLFPVEERSPFWHTFCSCLLLILVLLLCMICLIFLPFIHDTNTKDVLLGMCITIPLLIGVIYFIQWLLSFIPDIDGRPRINNTIYVCINVLIIVFLIKKNK